MSSTVAAEIPASLNLKQARRDMALDLSKPAMGSASRGDDVNGNFDEIASVCRS